MSLCVNEREEGGVEDESMSLCVNETEGGGGKCVFVSARERGGGGGQ